MGKQFPVPLQLVQFALQFLSAPSDAADKAIALEHEGTIYANSASFIEALFKSKLPQDQQLAVVNLLQFLSTAELTRNQHPDDVSVEDFVQTVESVIKPNIANLQATSPQAEQRFSTLLNVLRRFLKGESDYGQSVRANKLLTCHANNFAKVRIVSDIRPVFVDESEVKEPVGALITHILKIEYIRASNQKEEFFVGLDESELAELKVAVERAEKKAIQLRKMIHNSNISYIGLSQEEGKNA